MTDAQRSLLLEAMMHLEYVDDECTKEEAEVRSAAALYLVQRAVTGAIPGNYDDIMATARMYDAKREASGAIAQAKDASRG